MPDNDKHHPTYLIARGRRWAHCACGWTTAPRTNGNQTWAQLQFAQHLVDTHAKPRKVPA